MDQDVPLLAWCVKVDSTGENLTGEYRLAINGISPVRVTIDLAKILGRNPLPDVNLTITLDPKQMSFRENSYCTEWFSINDEAQKRNLGVDPVGLSDRTFEEWMDVVNSVMAEEENQVSFRIEAGGAPCLTGFYMQARFLPARAAALVGNDLLNAIDVNTINGQTFDLATYSFAAKFKSFADKMPCPPVLFSDVDIDEAKYKKILLSDGLKNIMGDIRLHQDFAQENCESYCRSPARHALVNIQSYPPQKTRGRPPKVISQTAKKIKLDTQDSKFNASTGTYTLSNRGTVKPILNFFIEKPSEFICKNICLHLSSKTWDSYFTEIKTFFDFHDRQGVEKSLPASPEILIAYIDYLRNERNLEYASIRSYLSAVRKVHEMNGVSFDSLSNPLVELILEGVKIDSKINKKVKDHRLAVTFDVMRVLGHTITCDNVLSNFDKQVYWTLFLFAFFGSRRMGELIFDNATVFDPIRAVTWNRIRQNKHTPHKIIMVCKFPKVSEHPGGITVDFIKGSDPVYCPVRNYFCLVRLRHRMGNFDPDHPVFVLESGKLITQKNVNDLLARLLNPLFPTLRGKWTCHSFRAGLASEMGARPAVFNKGEVKLAGGWDGDTCDRYSRQTGQGRERVLEKIDVIFRCVICFKFENFD